MKKIFGGIDLESNYESDAMLKGRLAQKFLAERQDVHEKLTAVFIEKVRELGFSDVTEDDVVIEPAPGILIRPTDQSMAATPDMLVFLRIKPHIRMVVEIKFTVKYADIQQLLNLYSDQCQMQIMVFDAIGSMLLLANSNDATSLQLVPNVAPICDINSLFILPNIEWQQDTKEKLTFLHTLCKTVAPQLLNGQDAAYNPQAPSTLKKAVAAIQGGLVKRRGRTRRHTDCLAYVFVRFFNFQDLPSVTRFARK